MIGKEVNRGDKLAVGPSFLSWPTSVITIIGMLAGITNDASVSGTQPAHRAPNYAKLTGDAHARGTARHAARGIQVIH